MKGKNLVGLFADGLFAANRETAGIFVTKLYNLQTAKFNV